MAGTEIAVFRLVANVTVPHFVTRQQAVVHPVKQDFTHHCVKNVSLVGMETLAMKPVATVCETDMWTLFNGTTCDPDNGTCLAGCSLGFLGDLCHGAMTSAQPPSSSSLVGAIVGGVLSLIVAVVVVVLVMVWLREQAHSISRTTDVSQPRGQTREPNKNNKEPEKTEDEEEESIYNSEDIYASYRSLGPRQYSMISRSPCWPVWHQESKGWSLRCCIIKLSDRVGDPRHEFRKDMQYPHEVGLQPENLNKNRFKALCAYDHSRVVLRRPKGDLDTDYINASYIKGCQRDKAYIATQGPRSHTVDDLWWMVWQENATQIIMLTNLKDGGKDKCEEYWPSVGTTKTYGHVTVTAFKTDTRADFVVRYFVLESKQGGDQRTVSQYHYLVWPDHGVPSTYSLVSFWRYVKARAQGAIPVVHCRFLAMLSSTEDKDTVSLAGPVAGAAVGCSVAFFIIGVVTTLLFKRLRSRQPSSTRRSPEDISMTCELGTSMPIPRPKENLETPSDSSNINLYESLKDRDDNNTSYYVNLTLPPTQ
ncbi:hypothetical protein C0Q70_15146 [Pomacea canaliculata]|uniref:protein-tyrosine-phosphatase n=1 Tax=Pomacea canaliculata TaxID=400727 RepID=A0A2T7NU26_POMCA|nr:hypothetical protein C0Q70_15146 [Pomacea canaliculata]